MSRTLLDVDQAAEHLTVTPRFVRTLVAERRVPFLKIGKFVRFDIADLDAWLDGCKVEVVD
jgi:excisionase family DNA binding protein